MGGSELVLTNARCVALVGFTDHVLSIVFVAIYWRGVAQAAGKEPPVCERGLALGTEPEIEVMLERFCCVVCAVCCWACACWAAAIFFRRMFKRLRAPSITAGELV